MDPFAGQVVVEGGMNVVVVGAGRGLGDVLSRMLVDRGHCVAAGLRRMDGREEHENLFYLPMDVTDDQEVEEAAAEIKKRLGKVDAVLYVAGILLPSDRMETLLTQAMGDLREQLEVNALGMIRVFRACLPLMKRRAKFLAVTSEGGSFYSEGSLFPAYSISKTAANKIVQTLRATMGETVTIAAVHPGRMNTDMGRTTAQIEPEEAAEGFCDLLEDRTIVDYTKYWFIDYLGKPMPL